MKETILIVGDTAEKELQDCALQLSTLLPEYRILPSSPDLRALTGHPQDSLYVVAIINLPCNQQERRLQALKALTTIDPHLPVVVWVHYGEENFARDALREGAYDFLIKPVTSEQVMFSLRRASDVRQMRTYIARLEKHVTNQSDISPMEHQAIMMNQMHHMLVDENGELKPLRVLEREIIEAALRYTNGCVSQAARRLGIGRSTLYRKVGEYDIHHFTRRDSQTIRPMIAPSAIRRVWIE